MGRFSHEGIEGVRCVGSISVGIYLIESFTSSKDYKEELKRYYQIRRF